MNLQKGMRSPQAMLESVCCLTFAAVIFRLAFSGAYLQYVTPKTLPYLYFTVAVMVIWGAFGLLRRARTLPRVRTTHCLTLALPVLLLLLPHSAVTSSSLSSGYIGGANTAGSVTTQIQQTPDAEVVENTYSLTGKDEASQTITVSDSEFSPWMTELYTNPDQYNGWKIKMTGFVFHDSKQMKANEFVPARLMMSCCVADLTPVGLLCQYDKTAGLKADDWVTVEGTLHYEDYDGAQEPQITVTSLTAANKVDGYLYPSY